MSEQIRALVTEALTKEGVAHRLQNAGNMFSVFFTDRPVRNYEDAKAQESFRFTAFFHSMLSQGVYLPPSPSSRGSSHRARRAGRRADRRRPARRRPRRRGGDGMSAGA